MFSLDNLTEQQVSELNQLGNFLNFQRTWVFDRFLERPENIVALFTGNQFGKTAGVAFSYVLRILGIHPVPKKNVAYWVCDECGKLLDPQELNNVRCKICGGTPEIRTSEHLFFALNKFEKKLLDWMKDKKHWKPSVLKFTENWLKNGLKERK